MTAKPREDGAPLEQEPPGLPREVEKVRRLSLARRHIAAGARFVYGAVREYYGQVDSRTAGLFRIAVGALTALDLLRHAREADWAYSNEGVVTNHYHLFRPDGAYNFSLFHAFSSLSEVRFAFGVAFLIHLALLFGFHTRFAAIATFLIVTSMDNRLVMVENGGYVVVNLVALYAMFLPLDRRFSIDAWRRSYREKRERTFEELEQRTEPPELTAPYFSLVCVLAILNLAAVYFFNVVNKSGNVWRSGETVHYVLWLNRMVTGLAVLAREILPFWATRVVTWSVLCVEALLVPLILAPQGRRITRPLAMVLLFGLHFSFGVMMRLGPFSWFLIGWSILLLTPEQWAWFGKRHLRRARPLVVELDRGSPLALETGRFLARLDHFGLLTLTRSSESDASPPLFRVRELDSPRTRTGVDGARRIASTIPFGRAVFVATRVLSFGLFDFALRFAESRRATAERLLGLRFRAPLPPAPPPSPLRRFGSSVAKVGREAALTWFAICAVLQVFNDNKSIPAWMKPKTVPGIMHATIDYPRLFQGWGMFAPNPIVDDGSIVVDAITIEGRHVDSFTNKAPELDLTKSDGLGLNQITQDYFNRIRLDHNKHYRDGMKSWILDYPKRTGRPEDEIVAADVYWVKDLCPKPHHDRPTDNRLIAIATYRKPGYRPRAGLPPLPPEPPVESAEHDEKDKDKDKDKDKAVATTTATGGN